MIDNLDLEEYTEGVKFNAIKRGHVTEFENIFLKVRNMLINSKKNGNDFLLINETFFNNEVEVLIKVLSQMKITSFVYSVNSSNTIYVITQLLRCGWKITKPISFKGFMNLTDEGLLFELNSL